MARALFGPNFEKKGGLSGKCTLTGKAEGIKTVAIQQPVNMVVYFNSGQIYYGR